MEPGPEISAETRSLEPVLQALMSALEAEDTEYVNELLDGQTALGQRELCEQLFNSADTSTTEEERNRWYWLMLMQQSRVDLTKYRGEDEKTMRMLCKRAEEALFETSQ